MNTVPRLINSFTPTNYTLSIDLSDAAMRNFSGTVSIQGDSTEPGIIRLHSKDLTVKTVAVDGRLATFTYGEFDELTISQESLKPGSHVVSLVFSGKITDAMHGLYPCYFEHDEVKKELFATQFESHHAREVFPCVDEPEAKATFDVTLTTPTGLTVLGNQPVKWQREEGGNLVTAFDTTPRMSSYLLAWVVGELHRKTAQTKDGVEVNVWATPAQRPEALDFALGHAVKTIEFFNDYFGVPYPLPKSDHVALPDFSSGAMENWGLITYREIALLADPETTTVASKQYIATVVSHELSHQWFGNLVTMKWWNNLWLNESFATMMEYVAVDAIHPEWNAWLDFASGESISALRRDAIDGVQAVQIEVNHPDEISSLFDGAIVYAKGARLLKMCRQFIGEDAFRAGLKSYFTEFAYKNTEADDLWRHLSDASGRDISKFMNTWISQSGYPVVHVGADSLVQEQFFIGPHQPSDKLWPIPLDGESSEDVPALLETETLHLPIADDERFNVHDASHFITHYQPEHLARLLDKVSGFDELGRLQLLHEQTLMIRGRIMPSVNLIDLLDAYRDETSESVWSIMGVAFGELKKFVENDKDAEQGLKKIALELADKQFARLGWSAKTNEPESDTKLRSLILGMMMYGEDPVVEVHAKELFDNGVETIDPEVRSLVIGNVVKRSSGTELVANLIELYQTTQSADLREDICAGVTSVRETSQIEYLLAQFTNSSVIRSQDLFRWFVYMIRSRYARESTWQWMIDNWGWVEKTFSGDKSYDDFPRYSAAGLATQEQLDSYIGFFTPKRDIPALTRVIDLGVKEIQARVEIVEADGPAVRERLKES